jgi:ankyrin repeat protein
MEPLLTAILEDDRLAVKRLLRADSGLATGLVKRARLYPTLHWLYVGDTALHLAAAAYRTQIVASLVAAGADVNAAANHRQGRPLHYAADGCPGEPAYDSKRQVKTIRYLLSAGADVHAQDRNGASALHRAVRTRSAAAVRLLRQSGADPALRNKSGSTPFHLAVQSTGRGGSGTEEARAAQAQIIRTFLSHGVSPNCRDGRGNTVLDCARSEWIKDLFSAIAGG